MKDEAHLNVECININVIFRSLAFVQKISFFDWSDVMFYLFEMLNLRFSLDGGYNHENRLQRSLVHAHSSRFVKVTCPTE